MSAKLKKKNEATDDLFAHAVVEGYTVKPWTLAQFVSLAPVLKLVTDALKEEGFDVNKEDLLNFDLDKNITFIDFLGYISKVVGVVGPVLPTLISVSARIKVEEAEDIEWGPSLSLVAKIIEFNWNHIKNWLGQILGKDPVQVLADLTKKMD